MNKIDLSEFSSLPDMSCPYCKAEILGADCCQPTKDLRMQQESIRKSVEKSLTQHFIRRDTNNGKNYCVDCGANEKKNRINHAKECAVTEALFAVDNHWANK